VFKHVSGRFVPAILITEKEIDDQFRSLTVNVVALSVATGRVDEVKTLEEEALVLTDGEKQYFLLVEK
jgi:hypothetical protein